MKVEKNQFFIISRGNKTFGNGYDRSYEGDVYIALEICGVAVAAKCVYCKYTGLDGNSIGSNLNKRRSFNMNDVDICPVTDEYAMKLGINVDTARNVG